MASSFGFGFGFGFGLSFGLIFGCKVIDGSRHRAHELTLERASTLRMPPIETTPATLEQ